MPASSLLSAARDFVDARLAAVGLQLAALDGAQAGETKSSAGDKFETSREMMQQERDRLEAQAGVMRAHRMALEMAEREPFGKTLGRGAVVADARGRCYLIATGLGKIHDRSGASAWVISPESPLGKALVGRLVREQVVFRGRTYAAVPQRS